MSFQNMDLFPFSSPRPGQREFLSDARDCALHGGTMVAHAPTGLGKTAVALTAMLEASLNEGGRTVYLTPRQSQHRAVVETVRMMGRRISMVDLVSRDSMCPSGKRPPCLYGRACHLQADRRITECAREILLRPLHSQELVSLCLRRGACPYISAKMALGGADLVVGDYSRVFSDLPDVIRFHDLVRPQRLVVDEAHNLPSRIMDMFSREIVVPASGNGIDEVWRDLLSKGHRLISTGELRLALEARGYPEPEEMDDPGVLDWLRLGDSAVRIAVPEGSRISIRFLEPELVVDDVIEHCAGALFMSGTLHPPELFAARLGLEETMCRSYPSPFDPRRRLAIVVSDVGTRYRDRCRESLEDMAFRLADLSEAVPGNVMVFLPSYSYLSAVRRCLHRIGQRKRVFSERTGMGKSERDGMVSRLAEGAETMMLCNIHGSFSEGVDLPAGCLSAVMVAGLPLPPPSLERKEMIDRTMRRMPDGVDRGTIDAYEALNKVMQACGRAIRREDDRAAIVLLDPRYMDSRNYRLLPLDLRPIEGDPLELLQGFFDRTDHGWGSLAEGERIITGH